MAEPTRWVPVKWRDASADPHDHAAVYIEARSQRDKTDLFVVVSFGEVLNRDGEFEWEPQPSSRDEEFVARTRFKTFEEANFAYLKHLVKVAPAAVEEGGTNG